MHETPQGEDSHTKTQNKTVGFGQRHGRYTAAKQERPGVTVVQRPWPLAKANSLRFYSGVGIFYNWCHLSLPPQVLRVPWFSLKRRGLTYIAHCTTLHVHVV
jgi:hypothetical protein